MERKGSCGIAGCRHSGEWGAFESDGFPGVRAPARRAFPEREREAFGAGAPWLAALGWGVPHALAALGIVLCAWVATLLIRLWHRRNVRRTAPKEEAEYYRLLAQAAGDIFFKVPADRERIVWTGDVGALRLGYEPGEVDLQPATFEKYVYPADLESLRKAWSGLMAREEMDLEIRLCRKDGQRRWVHIFAVPVPSWNGGRLRAVGVLRDTHDLHEVQEALFEARRLQTIGTMASGIAHEFNNHLTPIRGFIELALDHLGPQHPVAEGLRTALSRVDHCAELVAQVQAYGRKTLLLPAPISLPRFLSTALRVALTPYRGQGRRITLREEWPHSLPTLWADPAQLQEAIVQLVRNAVEAMPDGGTLTVRASPVYVQKSGARSHRGGRPGEYLCISVIDTGVGMSPELLEQALDPFFTTHGRAGRRGMGLPVVQGMVSQHDGWLEMRSQPGRGTQVDLYLPLQKREAPAPEPQPVMDADGTMQVLPAAPVGKLLVGEDEPLIRGLVRKVFEAEGWVVEEVSSFDEMLARLRSGPFDYSIVVADLTMGGPPAEEVLSEILRKQPGIKILLVSGFGRDERVEKLLATTHAAFVSKPFSPKEILAKVDELLTSGR